ncbi:MAG: calcium-binding protein [Cyanobacteria bacterium J06638_22]
MSDFQSVSQSTPFNEIPFTGGSELLPDGQSIGGHEGTPGSGSLPTGWQALLVPEDGELTAGESQGTESSPDSNAESESDSDADVLTGGSETDALVGQFFEARDSLSVGSDALGSNLNGGTGQLVLPGIGAMALSSQAGGELLLGNSENNTLVGGQGQDTLYGRGGNDTLNGNQREDELYGENGNDVLNGGNGKDTLVGGKGNDTYINIGSGGYIDSIVERPGEGIDLVTTLISYVLPEDVEELSLFGSDPINGFGNSSNNEIRGNGNHNLLKGNEGNDTLIGGNGNDTLRGDEDNDYLDGGTGVDFMEGGVGNDTLIGGNGSDTLRGDENNDFLNGGLAELIQCDGIKIKL